MYIKGKKQKKTEGARLLFLFYLFYHSHRTIWSLKVQTVDS